MKQQGVKGGQVDKFEGTPDYASTGQLLYRCCTPKDDLESLAYTLLEVCLGSLPWCLTAGKEVEEGHDWYSARQLHGMAIERIEAISHLRKHRQIPEFLCIWLDYLAGWKHAEAPSYQKLHDLLDSIQNMQFHAAAGREE
eukprot:jgi/Astpho2/2957/fgenesh1_pg.00051_%23_2_t